MSLELSRLGRLVDARDLEGICAWVDEVVASAKSNYLEEREIMRLRERSEALHEAYNLCTRYLGCGDSSCMFVKPRGMATNGGCRCVGRGEGKPGAAQALARLFKAAEALLNSGAPDA